MVGCVVIVRGFRVCLFKLYVIGEVVVVIFKGLGGDFLFYELLWWDDVNGFVVFELFVYYCYVKELG